MAENAGASKEKKKDESVVSEEMAQVEFDRWVNMMSLDIDEATLDDEDKEALKLNKRRIIAAMQAGSLYVNDKGEPVFTPQRSDDKEPITFYEPEGSALIAMDSKKAGKDVAKLYSAMADITHQSAPTFSKMKVPDLHVCMALTNLFLG